MLKNKAGINAVKTPREENRFLASGIKVVDWVRRL